MRLPKLRYWAITAFLFLLIPTLTPTTKSSVQSENSLNDKLRDIALSYLRNKYNLISTGDVPQEGLIAEFDGMFGRFRTPEEQIRALSEKRENLLKNGAVYSRVDVSLLAQELKDYGDKVVLKAKEDSSINYSVFLNKAAGLDSHVYREWPQHYFVFNKVTEPGPGSTQPYTMRSAETSYRLTEDWIEKAPSFTSVDSQSFAPIEEGGGDVSPDFDDSDFCCYPEEAVYNQPLTESQLLTYSSTLAAKPCQYGGNLASDYAVRWANGFNPNFRVYNNDCTNFVSQALWHGQWNYKGYRNDFKNWNNWWYYPAGSQNKGQSRTWTQAHALRYFVRNSGRGFNTPYPCDLVKGDLIFADWNNDGNVDHAMIITFIGSFNCNDWNNILLSQHTPARLGKPLADYQAEVPSARFYAFWICHNG